MKIKTNIEDPSYIKYSIDQFWSYFYKTNGWVRDGEFGFIKGIEEFKAANSCGKLIAVKFKLYPDSNYYGFFIFEPVENRDESKDYELDYTEGNKLQKYVAGIKFRSHKCDFKMEYEGDNV